MNSYFFYRILSKNGKNVIDWSLESLGSKEVGSCIATEYAARLASKECNGEIVLTNKAFDYAYLVRSDGSYKSIYNNRY